MKAKPEPWTVLSRQEKGRKEHAGGASTKGKVFVFIRRPLTPPSALCPPRPPNPAAAWPAVLGGHPRFTYWDPVPVPASQAVVAELEPGFCKRCCPLPSVCLHPCAWAYVFS